ncbi:MAG: ComEC/Rec2 family competence protein [Erysipelotrichaceae bacterium]
MLVTNWLIYLSISYLIIIQYFNHYFVSLIYLGFTIFRYKKILLLPILVIFLFLCASNIYAINESKEFVVVDISEHYILLEQNKQRIIYYPQDTDVFYYGDRVKVTSFLDLHYKINYRTFNFLEYLKLRQVKYQTNTIEVINRSNSLATQLYKYVLSLSASQKDFILTYTYQQKSNGFSDLFISNGLAIRTIIKMFVAVLAYFIVIKNKKLLVIFLYLILLLFFPFINSLKILLVYNVINFFIKDRVLALGCWSLSLMIYDFSLLVNASFLFIFLINFFGFLSLSDTYFKKIFSLSIIQFLIFAKCNILLLFSFSIFRVLSALVVLASTVSIFLPLNFSFLNEILLNIDTLFGKFIIKQVPYFIVIILLIVFISSKRKLVFSFTPLLWLLVVYQQYFNPFYRVLILDVGQGDCALISLPFNSYHLMIDAANNYSDTIYQSVIKPTLINNGITALDTLLVTHIDYDHSGSVSHLLNDYRVKKLLLSPEIIEKNGFKLIIPNNLGQTFSEGIGVDNHNSLISLFQVNGLRYAFLADVDKQIEKQLINYYHLEDFDIIKLAHHGSNTSSSQAILQVSNWQYALISSGYNNRYQHPHFDVIADLAEQKITSLNTANEGFIMIVGLFGVNVLITGNGRFEILS